MNSTHKCPRCGTEYFQAIDECDWCAEVKPQPLGEADTRAPTEESEAA